MQHFSFSMVFAAFWNLNITVCMVFLSFLLPLRSLPPSFPSFHLQHFGPGTFRKAWYTWHFGAQTQNLGIEFPASPCFLACLLACLPACLLASLHLFSFLDPNDNWHIFFILFWSILILFSFSRLFSTVSVPSLNSQPYARGPFHGPVHGISHTFAAKAHANGHCSLEVESPAHAEHFPGRSVLTFTD